MQFSDKNGDSILGFQLNNCGYVVKLYPKVMYVLYKVFCQQVRISAYVHTGMYFTTGMEEGVLIGEALI